MKLIDILVEELPKRGGWPKSAANATQDEDGEVCFSRCRIPDFGFASWNNGDWVSGAEFHTSKATDYAATIITREQYEAALSAKNEGWIEWGGGECPVPCGTTVDVKHRCGAVSENQQAWPKRHKESDVMVNLLSNAGQAFWRHENSVMDIIAYRLHKPQQEEQAKADDEADLNECIGQDAAPVWNGEGLPPVGMEIEYSFAKVNYRTDFSRGKVLAYGMQNVFMEHWASKNEFIQPLDKIEFRPIRSEADRKRDEAVKTIMLTGWCQDAAEEIYDLVAAGKVPGMKLED